MAILISFSSLQAVDQAVAPASTGGLSALLNKQNIVKEARPVILASSLGMGFIAKKNHIANIAHLTLINAVVGKSIDALLVVGTYGIGALLGKFFNNKPKAASKIAATTN